MEVTGLTKERMLDIEAQSVVSGTVNGSGQLILTKHDNSTIDAGHVVGATGPTGDTGPQGPEGLIKLVSQTSNTSSTEAGKWTKFAKVDITAQYQDISLSLDVDSYANGTYALANKAFVDIRVKQNVAMASAPNISVIVLKRDQLEAAQIVAITTVNTALITTVEFYVKDNLGYDRILFREIANDRSGSTLTYYSDQAFVVLASLPAGTKTYGIYAESTVKPGSIMIMGQSAVPAGWLKCQGQTISRTTYWALFDAIGTQFGAGDGSTTFVLPNIQGRIPIGANGSDSDFNAIAKTGGSKTSTASHTHSTPASTSGTESADHTHTHAHTHTTPATATGNNSVGHSHSIPIANLQQTLTASTGSAGYSVTSVAGTSGGNSVNHTHTLPAMTTDSISTTATSGKSATHTHSVSAGTSGASSAEATSGNLPPYICFDYMIKT